MDVFKKLNGKMDGVQKICFLTHTDLDGEGVAVLATCFDDITVKHLTNSQMSSAILREVMENTEYDMIIACDISVNEFDAASIAKLPPSKRDKFILLDHHETAKELSRYPWAVVEEMCIPGSFRDREHPEFRGQLHSSGVSLLYDYLESQGLMAKAEERGNNMETVRKYVTMVSGYDMWDWKNLYHDDSMMELNMLFHIYGAERFDGIMTGRMKEQELFSPTDKLLLDIEHERISQGVDRIMKNVREVILQKDGKYYSCAYSVSSEYMANVFESMKEKYPDKDLYMVDYGSGIALRSSKPEIDVSRIAASLGGGGHKAAAGIRRSNEMILGNLRDAMGASGIYMDETQEQAMERTR